MLTAISFLGSRSAAVDKMTRLYRDVFMLNELEQADNFAAFELPNGDRVELFGPNHAHTHFDRGPVGGFEVEDIEEGLHLLQRAGVEILTSVGGSPGRTRWIHYRAPDGYVYELVHHPHR